MQLWARSRPWPHRIKKGKKIENAEEERLEERGAKHKWTHSRKILGTLRRNQVNFLLLMQTNIPPIIIAYSKDSG